MISSLAAMLQVSLRRSRASWPIVGAAGVICVLASTLMAAGPMYAGAVSIAGLHRVLADAPVTDANVAVSFRVDPAAWDAADQAVRDALDRAIGRAGGTVSAYGRSDSFELPGRPAGELTDLVTVAFADGIEEHADLVDGVWPAEGAAGEPMDVAVSEDVASRLGLAVGADLRLVSRATDDFSLPARVAGTFRIRDPGDPFWWEEPQVVDGLVTSERFATHGPLFTSRSAFLARATSGRTEVGWRAFPRPDGLRLEDIAAVRSAVAGLRQRIEAAMAGTSVTVETGLPAILQETERSLLVSRTGVLLLTAQFVVLAAYAVLLSAALLVEHRRTDTAMLRSRGAGPARIGLLSLVEGLLLTMPAALLGPLVAAVGLRLLNVTGPLAEIGLRIDPLLTSDAFVASSIAAAACLVALLLPALPRIRAVTAVHGSVGRAETRTVGQRFGLDVALLAIAGIGLWQLRLYGAPLTRSVQGTLGIDPLIVATPAIGFLAGAVLALRIVPLISAAIERVTSRRRTLVPSLGARQLSRRPLRYTRAALLLMLAVSMGVFAITYTRTWSDSQRDQATFQVGADVRAEPGRRTVDPPPWALRRTYADVEGVTQAMAVGLSTIRVPRAEGSGTLIGIDADVAGDVIRLRPDMLDGSVTDLVAPLASSRPMIEAVRLPGEPRRLRVDLMVSVDRLQAFLPDPETGEAVVTQVDPSTLVGRHEIQTAVVVRDAAGQMSRFGGSAVPFAAGTRRVEISLGDTTRTAERFANPLDLLAVEVGVVLPDNVELTAGSVRVEAVAASSPPEPADHWQPVSMDLDHGWRSTASIHGLPHQGVVGNGGRGTLGIDIPADGLPTVIGADEVGRGTVITFAPRDLDLVGDQPIPAVATKAYLEATARSVGDVVPVDVGGVDRQFRITSAIRAFPALTPTTPALVIDLPTLAALRFEGSDAIDPPDAWWFTVEPGSDDAVATRLREPTVGSASVVTLAERAEALATDPVALGIIGALGIGIAAAAAFAVVGFVVSAAVSARERVTEFALLRALGLSSRQLSGWLSLENATLALISLVAGTGLGLLVAWVALPFVTVTRRAETAFPPVEVAVPWSTIAVLEVVGIVALSIAIVGLTWSLGRVAMASTLRKGED